MRRWMEAGRMSGPARLLLGIGLVGLALVGLRTAVARSEAGFALEAAALPTAATRLARPTASEAAAVLSSAAPTAAAPAATPRPFSFVFPRQPAPAVSAWRPPLYPVPWAPTAYDHFFFQRPIAADKVNWPLGNYRYGGIFFENVVHTGVDIDAPKGTPVLAAGPGKVIWAGVGLYSGLDNSNDPYGIAVAIRHDFGYQGNMLYTVYGHMARLDVARGQHVEAGEQLGLVGETGFTTGPHLHFEVRMGDNNFFATYNPELWMAPPQGWGILAGRVLNSGGLPVQQQTVVVRSKSTRQTWNVISYGAESGLNSDAYYRENLVIGDLPAGSYQLEAAYLGKTYQIDIEILAGLVNYFTFHGREGFSLGPPPTETP